MSFLILIQGLIECDDMKNILVIITTSFAPFGGLTTVMMNYYREINKTEFFIDFASKNEDVSGTLINELKLNGSQFYDLGDRRKNPAQYFGRLWRVFKIKKYDVVHINANSATASAELAIAKMHGVPKRIIHIHNSTGNYIRLHYLIRPIFCSLYTDAIACSGKSGKWAFENRKFIVLNNAIDTKKFAFNVDNRQKLRQKLRISDDCFVVGHSGKINQQKNHNFLIDIFDKYHKKDKNSILLLAGDGELRDQIEDKVKAYHLENAVIFLGMIPDVYRYLSVMDCMVFPSLWEGLPLSLIEAQANGLKCVVSDKVTKEANVTKKEKYLSLDDGINVWVECMSDLKSYDRQKESDDNTKLMIKNGYDSKRNVKTIEHIYAEKS